MHDRVPDASALLELFVEKRPFYEADQVPRLAGISAERLSEAIREGEIEPLRDGDAVLVAWEDVAFFALDRWTPRQIAHVLRAAGHPRALPTLNQLRTITIELPAYQIRLLHHLADARSKPGAERLSVSDVLEYELDALASDEDLREMERILPGFAAAASFPSFHDGPQLVAHTCLFCGTAIEPEREVCAACEARHVPAPIRAQDER